ncbi:hypothetical protein [Polynucleobacter sp. Tro8-14-1]|uniref:hypothetical protein n=1 Tax=Polynucleobacter sp. Tro8-14-1 TaxID=1758383 RepID=UPI001C0A9C08|nr:hypothetical protein [Polynucleobacter sp. Tro8-14-1]MBU3564167.1 hypothetical protein [Polynucleobacter sp. Tro8-14-1]
MKTKAKTVTSKARSAAKPMAKVVKKPVAKALSKPVAKTAAKTAVKATVKSSIKPAAKSVVKPVAKSITKPLPKPILKTPQKTMTKTAPKVAAKTMPKTSSKPTTKTILGQPTVSTAPVQAINEGAQMTQSNQAVEDAGATQPITGRGVFAVRTLGEAVSVEAAFLAEDGNVLRLPAVFPNRQYAIEQIDELRALVNRHFDELDQGGL